MTYFEKISKSPKSLAQWFCHNNCEKINNSYECTCSELFREMTLFSYYNEHCGEFVPIQCDYENQYDKIEKTAIYKWLIRSIEDDYIDNFEKLLSS